jgi:hypothetical protein
MPMIKPNKPFSTEDEMYGKKMGRMPKPMPQPQKGMTRKMGPMPKPMPQPQEGMTKKMAPMPRKKSPSKRDALLNQLQKFASKR